MLAVTLGGPPGTGLNIAQFSHLSITAAQQWLEGWKLPPQEEKIGGEVRREILLRLGFLNHVGLGYLGLDRESGTLSGGEAQRIRLATQIGSKLTGVLYILDEPSIGLHQRDNERLLETLRELRDLGNTVIVVEHDEDTIRAADYLVDMGPYAGVRGGQVVAAGTVRKCWPIPNRSPANSSTARKASACRRRGFPPAMASFAWSMRGKIICVTSRSVFRLG